MKTKTRILLVFLLLGVYGIMHDSVTWIVESQASGIKHSRTVSPVPEAQHAKATQNARLKIQLALLLDTSNSMDGLIDQARNELWKIVNALRNARKDSAQAELEIALYEYGNDRLSSREGYVRQVSGFTSDLDKLSEDLFSLTTNGGSEFCGYVIRQSLNELAWEDSDETLKMIFIAGNEPFTQGNVNYKAQCSIALGKGIYINTIHCGDREVGISSMWQDGALLAEGDYFHIDQNQQVVYIETPYDDQITALNTAFNNTYIYYGKQGQAMKSRQEMQDFNASKHSKGNSVLRTTSKTTSYYYNGTWDLVDAYNAKPEIIAEIDIKTLPDSFQHYTVDKLKIKITQVNNERESIKKKIAELSTQREAFIAAEMAKTNQTQDHTLGASILRALQKQTKRRGFDGV